MNRDPPLLVHEYILLALLPVGAALAARGCRWLPVFFIYGCLGGTWFAMEYISVAGRKMTFWGEFQDLPTVFICGCSIVVIEGVCCRLAAMLVHRTDDRREARKRGYPPRCDRCGYILLGLFAPRCPECGTPIEVGEKPV